MQTGRLFTGGINTPHAGCALEFLKGRSQRTSRACPAAGIDGPDRRQLAARPGRAVFWARLYDPFVCLERRSVKEKISKVPDLLPPKEIGEVRLERRRELREVVDDAVGEKF